MSTILFYAYLRRQIPIMIFLSTVPGIAYLFFGYNNHLFVPALLWYLVMLLVSLWGYRLYTSFAENRMGQAQKRQWYLKLRIFFYVIFSLWTCIFLIYATHTENNIHYIAIFTQIGASVVAATLLFPDKKIFIPTILLLTIPLSLYFLLIGEVYAYVLSLFSLVLMGVLFYSAFSSNRLIHKTSYQASRDMLTGLFNRHYAISLLQENINTLNKGAHATFILLIDLDHFKTINDTLGHDVGDLLLQEVANRMRTISGNTHIARLGGDEFIIISNGSLLKDEALLQANALAQKLLATLKATYFIDDHQLYISASIGISLIDDPKRPAHEFIKEADIAMYEVKASGKDNVFVFDKQMSEKIQRHLELEHLLPYALENSEFYLQFQPQVSTQGKILGCEVLARWENHRYGLVPPSEFIPLAEQTTHIIKLGEFIIEKSFQILSKWDQEGIKLKQFSINLSMRQLFHPNFLQSLLHLSRTYLKPQLQNIIIFEVTESIAAGNINYLVETMNKIKEHGFRFSLDDFGTGYSSLSYLRTIPIDELKIDRSFINELDKTDKDHAMIDAIFTMAEKFKFSLVAEGVEKESQLDYLKEHNCPIVQGYLFSKPIDENNFIEFYHQHKN